MHSNWFGALILGTIVAGFMLGVATGLWAAGTDTKVKTNIYSVGGADCSVLIVNKGEQRVIPLFCQPGQ